MDSKIHYELVDGGIAPTLAHNTDSGYDLHLVKKLKVIRRGSFGEVSLYDTGVIISPPDGYYFDMVARSSISKTGHTLANNFGVIDSTYRGHIMAAMLKYDFTAPDLEIPKRYIQLILRPVLHFDLVEVASIDETERGPGGFGSTDK